jgi:hypothetical protein
MKINSLRRLVALAGALTLTVPASAGGLLGAGAVGGFGGAGSFATGRGMGGMASFGTNAAADGSASFHRPHLNAVGAAESGANVAASKGAQATATGEAAGRAGVAGAKGVGERTEGATLMAGAGAQSATDATVGRGFSATSNGTSGVSSRAEPTSSKPASASTIKPSHPEGGSKTKPSHSDDRPAPMVGASGSAEGSAEVSHE